MKKINLKNTMVSMPKVICIIIVAIALSIGITYDVMTIANHKAEQKYQEVTYDVIAENDTQYVLQDCDDTNHYETIEKSEMFGIGETVICIYVDQQITSIWLYVDC